MPARLPFLLRWTAVLVLIVGSLLGAGLIIRGKVAASFDADQRIRAVNTLLFSTLKAQLDEETGLRGYLATRDPLFLQPYWEGYTLLPQLFPQLEMRLAKLQLPVAVSSVQDAERTNSAWQIAIAQPILEHRGYSTLALQKRGKTLIDRFRVDAARIEASLVERNAETQRDVQTNLTDFSFLIIASALLLFGASSVFLTLQVRALNTLDRERQRTEKIHISEASFRAAFEAEKRVVDTLQRAFSQRELPTLSSMTFSAAYIPATEEAKVGGDWYDAIEIGSDRTLFVIGDIAGHGIEAAVAMDLVRREVVSATILDIRPASILQSVNRRMLAAEGPMATAVVGIADAQRYEFTYSTAGHPPPILVEPGRAPRLLDAGGLPLGITREAIYSTRVVQTVPGAMLIVYTDGLIEHSRDVLDGERELLEAISAISARINPAAAIYESIFRNRALADDVAILTIGFKVRDRSTLKVSRADGKSGAVGQLDGATRSASDATDVSRAS